jgi:hypothetical protein
MKFRRQRLWMDGDGAQERKHGDGPNQKCQRKDPSRGKNGSGGSN